MKKIKFIWIDDDPRRSASSENLKSALKISGQFIDVKSDYQDILSELLKNSQPDIVLIDHNLEDNSTGVFKKGSTFAAYIRETWPECPIVCITGQEIRNLDSQKRSLYDEIISISRISHHYPTILSIAKSFRTLKDKRPNNISDLLALMKAPKKDHERLQAIIPKELKSDFDDKGLIPNISDWIRNHFLKRPGFVYDRLWISTILGIKENSFEKVENIFAKDKYSGVFADPSYEVWWKSKVLTTLSKNVSEFGLSWEKGRLLSGISKRDYSSCFVTNEEYPETVAFLDETKDSKRAAMKINQTLPHQNFEDLLYFDEIRIMKPA
ncbi:MAG: hypothetical protein R2804_08310 [Cyclobacteriaceae bacterium]